MNKLVVAAGGAPNNTYLFWTIMSYLLQVWLFLLLFFTFLSFFFLFSLFLL